MNRPAMVGHYSCFKSPLGTKHPVVCETEIAVGKLGVIVLIYSYLLIVILLDVQYVAGNHVGIDAIALSVYHLEIAVVLGIIVEGSRNIEVQLMQLKTITRPEPHTKLYVVVEGIRASDVKLVDESLALGIAHV